MTKTTTTKTTMTNLHANHHIHPTLAAIGQRALIVSCQPVVGGALDRDDIVVALAQAAVSGGANAVRIEGITRVHAVKAAVNVPVIGIVKRPKEPRVYITPYLEDVDALAEAGADIIAFDATQRPRPVSISALIERGHNHKRVMMADCATAADAANAASLGCEIVGTTLSGYVTPAGDPNPEPPCEPDLDLVRALASRGLRVIAEGRINTPAQAKQALDAGAWAVTVGTALTRLELTTRWFTDAMQS